MIKIYKYGEVENSRIFDRTLPTDSVADTVREIVENVRQSGDEALFEYTKKLDGADLSSLAVSKEEIEDALEKIEPEFLEIIKNAAKNIKSFHEKQLRTDYVINKSDGIVLGQRILPVEKAGIYVPGGTAAYPSTVLMNAIPAKIAGVGEIIMVTPPGKDGSIAPAILAAASIAGVDRIFKLGGAQAIAALAYSTQSVPKVDKIVGPGNAYVAEAKRQVYGKVSIDMIAGPSEILVAADAKSDPAYVAADLLSQAEHDRMASAVLVTDSQELADAVAAELEVQLAKLPRQEMAIRPAAERRDNFLPISEGFTCDQAHCEAERCLQCDLRKDITRVKVWTEYANK